VNDQGGFLRRNREELAAAGIDPSRLPPGQYRTERFPVLHIGEVPDWRDLSSWDLRIVGHVEQPYSLGFDELRSLPAVTITPDIHCVTKWSVFGTTWTGVRVADLLDRAGVRPGAGYVLQWGDGGYTTNVPLADIVEDGIVAYELDGAPIPPEHGYPARVVLPRLYFWKSAKWLRALEVLVDDRPGYWERNGYHMRGDPFGEERFGRGGLLHPRALFARAFGKPERDLPPVE
jgi:DMSO/TMAO reductase YedYZ molybdopterin-dependent catalytic subunit